LLLSVYSFKNYIAKVIAETKELIIFVKREKET